MDRSQLAPVLSIGSVLFSFLYIFKRSFWLISKKVFLAHKVVHATTIIAFQLQRVVTLRSQDKEKKTYFCLMSYLTMLL